jgi:transcriptional regulator with XRE-family HTH domain
MSTATRWSDRVTLLLNGPAVTVSAMTAEPLRLRGESPGLQERVASEIRALMARQRITQAGMARRLNRPQSYVSRIYNGLGSITLHDLDIFARALGVNAEDLLTGAAPNANSGAVRSYVQNTWTGRRSGRSPRIPAGRGLSQRLAERPPASVVTSLPTTLDTATHCPTIPITAVG